MEKELSSLDFSFIYSSLKGYEETQVAGPTFTLGEEWDVWRLGIKKRGNARQIPVGVWSPSPQAC